jgi:hypothetical protein
VISVILRVAAQRLRAGERCGARETLNLIGDQFGLTGSDGFRGAVGAHNDNFGVLGYVTVRVVVFA